jgi:hypothetical protein
VHDLGLVRLCGGFLRFSHRRLGPIPTGGMFLRIDGALLRQDFFLHLSEDHGRGGCLVNLDYGSDGRKGRRGGRRVVVASNAWA